MFGSENPHKEMTCTKTKGQLNSEWIYEAIVSPKMLTKNYQDFCPGSLLDGRAEILQIFGWHFGRNDDLMIFEFNCLNVAKSLLS